MKLYIVRHASSKRNAGYNSSEDAELTEDGKEQARRLGKYFHKVRLNKVYCSTLKRARETFEEIRPYVLNVPVEYTPRIREHEMGICGKDGIDDWNTYAKIAREKSIEFHKFRPNQGESLEDTYKRARRFYKFLIKKHNNDEILLVCHGIFGLYVILNFLGLGLLEGRYYQLSNASVSTLNIDKKGNVKNFQINDYTHLIKEGMRMVRRKNEKSPL